MPSPQQLGVLLGLAAVLPCGDSSGPDLEGPRFVRATIDGSPWDPGALSAGCADYPPVR